MQRQENYGVKRGAAGRCSTTERRQPAASRRDLCTCNQTPSVFDDVTLATEDDEITFEGRSGIPTSSGMK